MKAKFGDPVTPEPFLLVGPFSRARFGSGAHSRSSSATFLDPVHATDCIAEYEGLRTESRDDFFGNLRLSR